MRIKDPMTEAEEPYNMVPLTDMVFNLLIFFMAATTFAQVEKDMQLQLPREQGAFQAISDTPPQLVVNISDDGRLIVSAKTYEPNDLEALVTAAVKVNPDREVLIRADEQSIVKHLTRVAAICRRAGVKHFKIGYIDTGGGSGA